MDGTRRIHRAVGVIPVGRWHGIDLGETGRQTGKQVHSVCMYVCMESRRPGLLKREPGSWMTRGRVRNPSRTAAAVKSESKDGKKTR